MDHASRGQEVFTRPAKPLYEAANRIVALMALAPDNEAVQEILGYALQNVFDELEVRLGIARIQITGPTTIRLPELDNLKTVTEVPCVSIGALVDEHESLTFGALPSPGPRAAGDFCRAETIAQEHGALDRVAEIKNAGNQLIQALNRNVPSSRELSLARTRVEEAVMWATKGMTR